MPIPSPPPPLNLAPQAACEIAAAAAEETSDDDDDEAVTEAVAIAADAAAKGMVPAGLAPFSQLGFSVRITVGRREGGEEGHSRPQHSVADEAWSCFVPGGFSPSCKPSPPCR